MPTLASAVAFSSAGNARFVNSTAPAADDVVVLDTLGLSFAGLAAATGGVQSRVDFIVDFAPVPEPTVAAGFGLAAGATLLRRRARA